MTVGVGGRLTAMSEWLPTCKYKVAHAIGMIDDDT